MRILAHVTGDSYLNEFFASGSDIHTMIASHWLSKPIEQVTPLERDRSKQIAYGIVYGIGSVSLGEMLGVEPSEATKFIHSFLDKFPGEFCS
jgi:DNA polymerase I